METPCKNCCFAMYKQTTQTDCKLGLLDKYKTNDIKIVEAHDEEKKFFVIHTYCRFFRNNNPLIDNIWTYHNKPEEEQIKQVYSENIPKIDLIIYLSDRSTLSKLQKTTQSISLLTYKPQQILVIGNQSKLTYLVINDTLQKLSIPYHIDFTTQKLTKNQCITIISRRLQNPWFTVLNAGKSISNYLERFNLLLNEQFKYHLVYRIDKIVITNTVFFDMLGKHNQKPFYFKLKKYKKDIYCE